jgi:hypothetical protein
VNNTEEQDSLLKDLGFIKVHLLLKPNQIDYLKTIDEERSKAIRTLIDDYMVQTKRMKLERYLLLMMVSLILLLGILQIMVI